MNVIPVFKDRGQPQIAYTADLQDLIRDRMETEAKEAKIHPRPWPGLISLTDAERSKKYASRREGTATHVIALRRQGLPTIEIAKRVGCPTRSVRRILQAYREKQA